MKVKKEDVMKRFNFRGVILMVAVVVAFASFSVWAEESEEIKPSASADVGVFSKYVWRGWELSDDSVVIQPSATVEYKGFSMNLWGNLDTDYADSDDSEFNETDLTLAYDTSIGDFDVGVGYIYYALDNANDPEEIYVSVCATKCPVSPTLTVYKDFTEFIGWYLNLGISHSFEFEKGITLDLGGSVGYYYSEDDGFVEADSNGNDTTAKYRNFHDGKVSVGMTIPLDTYMTLTPMIAYSFPLSGNADDRLTADSFSNDSDYFFGGVTLSIAF